MKKIFFLNLLLVILTKELPAQTINQIILQKMSSLPVDLPDLKFKYIGIDTVQGIEIRYYYRKDNVCSAHLFFVEQMNIGDCDGKLSLKSFLSKAGDNYHYMKFDTYSSFFGCEYNDIDTFNICRDERLYTKALRLGDGNNGFYRLSDYEYAFVSRVTTVAYRFQSIDIKYSQFFYHFNRKKVKVIEKLLYKQVLARSYFSERSLFNGEFETGSIDCMTKFE